MDEAQRKKLGDILCDLGKYMLTVVPFSYLISDKPSVIYIIVGTTLFGLLMIIFGLYFVKNVKRRQTTGQAGKKKVKVLKNSTFVIEEESFSA